MIPSDFVELAIKLSANPSEAAQRSAISRAYYGAFHASKALIESCGFRFAGSGEAHLHVPYCMEHSTDQELADAGRHLDNMRLARNLADYDLDDRTASGSRAVGLQLKAARLVLDSVATAQVRLPGFSTSHPRLREKRSPQGPARG